MTARLSLRARLTLGAVAGAALMLAVLIVLFNVLLDARLRSDGDNVLRERAATVLRGLVTVNGRLAVAEAPDKSASDTQTWIFVAGKPVEQPAGVDPRNRAAAARLAQRANGFATVDATRTRMKAVTVTAHERPLGVVVVASSLAPYRSTAQSALLGSLLLGLVTLVVIAALSRWLIRRALRPVAQMTTEAADWSEHDLTRRFFAGDPHDELSTLASVFDALLARLADSLRRERTLTAEISHELRTPLAKILAEAELATSRARTPGRYHETLEAIAAHAAELQRVLETLLLSARAEMHDGTDSSDATQIARGAVQALRGALAAEHKTAAVLASGPVRVAAPADLLERILAPLLENAARFARRRIELEISVVDGAALLEVRDDGPGVDPLERERIFDPGFRSQHGRDPAHAGSGLGLPLARRLARAVGGDVQARASGDGGLFAVRVPLR